MKRLFSLAAILSFLVPFQAVAGSSLPVTRSIGAPVGFAAACAKYKWLCGRVAAQQLHDAAGITLLQKVNRAVNGRIIPAEDRPSSHGDAWSLPVAGRGDCEDYALQKMKDLIDAGFPSNRLALSVVIGPHDQNHVVLIARTDGGDYARQSHKRRQTLAHDGLYVFGHSGFSIANRLAGDACRSPRRRILLNPTRRPNAKMPGAVGPLAWPSDLAESLPHRPCGLFDASDWRRSVQFSGRYRCISSLSREAQ